MSVVLKAAPSHGTGEVLRSLQDVLSPSPAVLGAGAGSIDISEPLPVYGLRLQDADGGDPIGKARHVGWRYLVDGPGTPLATADLGGTGPNARFLAYSSGRHAEALAEVAEFAGALVAQKAEQYEPRILEVPALNWGAIWLAGQVDHLFVPFDRAGRPVRREVLSADGLVKTLQTLAVSARKRHSPGSPGPAFEMGG